MPRVRDYSITKKLTWMNMLVSGGALLLACAAFVAYELVTFHQATLRTLSIQARIVGSNSASALLFNDPRSAENTLAALKAAPNIMTAWIYTPDGRPFAGYWRDRAGPSPPLPAIAPGQTEAQWFKDNQIILASSILFQAKRVGIVYIQSDLQEINDRLKRYAGIVAVILSASLMAAFLMSRGSQRTISEPIVRLAETARIVSREKDYSVRAAATGDRGELSTLIEAFNEMLTEIQGRDAALREARNVLEQRVKERTAELEAANKELEAFSYSVSHDLRAPLRSIDGFSQALLEDYADKLDAQGQDTLRRVRAAAQRMAELIDGLLTLSRVTRSELRREIVDLTKLAQGVVEELERSDPHRPLEVAIAKGLAAHGDPRLLRGALQNLLGNAWKFTSRKPQARIEFGWSNHADGNGAFFVRDNGDGFDMAYANKLFAPFQRLHRQSEFPGTGIGLATVQRVILRHGGRIWAEGTVGQGATFYFTLGESE